MSDWYNKVIKQDVKYYDEKPSSTTRRVLTYGLTKSGKTYLGATFPSPFVLDTDGSLSGIPQNMRHFPSITMRSEVYGNELDDWKLLIDDQPMPEYNPIRFIIETIRRIRDRKHPFDKIEVKTFVFDGLTTLGDILVNQILMDKNIGRTEKISNGYVNPLKGKPRYDEYFVLEKTFEVIFSTLNDLHVNIYATACLKMDKDEHSGRIMGFPDILGGFRHVIGHRFDSVLYMERSDANKITAHTAPYRNFDAGVRNYTGPTEVINPTYHKIFKPI
jgi:hypothetical protein